MLRRMLLVFGHVLFRADVWVERVFVSTVIFAMVILPIVIAWGLIDGRYAIVMPS
jgi:hypothetical protein